MKLSGELFLTFNTVLTAFSMMLAARIMHRRVTWRLYFAALISSIYALAALALPPSPLASVPVCLTVSILTTLFAFGKESPLTRFRLCGLSLAAALLLSGVSAFLFSHGMNAALATGAALMLVMLGAVVLRAPAPPAYECTHVEIVYNRSILRIAAMIDSGNLLTDPITNLPVIVCSRRALAPLLPPLAFTTHDYLPPGFRFISVRTAAGHGLMQCFTPQSLRIEVEGIWHDAHGVIAIAPNAYDGTQALVPRIIFEGGI